MDAVDSKPRISEPEKAAIEPEDWFDPSMLTCIVIDILLEKSGALIDQVFPKITVFIPEIKKIHRNGYFLIKIKLFWYFFMPFFDTSNIRA